MKLLTVKDIATKWNVSERCVRYYCEHGKIKGAVLKSKTWYIPDNAPMPPRRVDYSSNNILKTLLEEYKSKTKGRIYHKTQIDFAYNSNHIEGSTLTKDQTRYIFETNTIGIDKNTSVRVDDVIETSNHFKCFDYLLETITKGLDENLIKKFHEILKTNTSDSRKDWFNVGDYKQIGNYIGDSETAKPEHVKLAMEDLLKWYLSLKEVSLNDILEFHVRFEKIHPFQDGNGRVGRLIMFRECLRYNIIPFVILDKYRMFYYRGLKQWNKQKGFLVDTCLQCQDEYIKILDYLGIKH